MAIEYRIGTQTRGVFGEVCGTTPLTAIRKCREYSDRAQAMRVNDDCTTTQGMIYREGRGAYFVEHANDERRRDLEQSIRDLGI